MTSGLYGLTFAELEQRLRSEGLKSIHARSLWSWLYRGKSPEQFPAPLKRWWEAQELGNKSGGKVRQEWQSSDGLTRKWLLDLSDGESVETVLMRFSGRWTACVSSQVGCAMGCVFCATGQAGFTRHLGPEEIVDQLRHVQAYLEAEALGRLRNVVLMGMGEPLHNYEAVMQALEIVTDRRGMNLGPGNITLSTVGVIPGIRRMAEEQRPYHLAVSLHGAREEIRSALVPVSRRWPLDELIEACRFYGERTERRIFFEWTLIEGANDSLEQADELAELLQGIPAHINLIPLNPTSAYAGQATSCGPVQAFKGRLKERGYVCTVRQRRGIDVAAGCGQLRGGEGVGRL
ncbi:MAG: 23S rRNA (adenine(2503)-C(2))-methyltransferase RlmN [Blastochloris sp.]|nr:23S rRNA (adenine(2503)-C(2))-methyltransferase RlmN [Blastochloris sp.]